MEQRELGISIEGVSTRETRAILCGTEKPILHDIVVSTTNCCALVALPRICKHIWLDKFSRTPITFQFASSKECRNPACLRHRVLRLPFRSSELRAD